MNEKALMAQEIKPEVKGKIYASYGHDHEANWILPLGFKLTKDIKEADVVVFGGGKDVDPGFYGEKIGRQTGTPNARDRAEREDFLEVQKMRSEGKSILSVGVCRGHQLLTALSGGKLIQHIGNNHYGAHSISTFDKKSFKVNSIHHQMVFPYKMNRKDFKILAWSTNTLSSTYLNGHDKEWWLPEGFKEIEAIYLTNTHSLGIQSHPEMMIHNESYQETISWMQDLFLKAYENKI